MKKLRKIVLPAVTIFLSLAVTFMSACVQCGIYLSTLDWAVAVIEAYYYEDVSEEAIREAGLENLSDVLDIYSSYYTPEEYSALTSSNAGSRSGIGVSYQYISPDYGLSIGSGVYIISVLGNSPAERSGLRVGMFIREGIAADGTHMTISDNSDFSTFINAHSDGEQFTLVTDQGEYTMAKTEYTMSYCRMATSSGEYSVLYDSSDTMTVEFSAYGEEGGKYSFLPEGTAYISLSQFYGNAAYEMAALLSQFNSLGCTSLIFDLRNNGGGYVDVMQRLALLFTADLDQASPIAMYAQYKDGSTTDYSVISFTSNSSCYLPAGTDMTVLANNGTASASEALIGVLISDGVIDYSDIYVTDFSDEYLELTGTADKDCRTYGKGIMQTTFTYYLTGEALKLTVAKIFWPNDTCIHDVGVGVNDGCNAVAAEWNITYADEELQAVCAMLSA